MKYNNIQKKYIVKIPENINVIYCDKKNIITFIGSIKTTSLKVPVKIFFSNSTNLLSITNLPNTSISTILKKQTKSLQGTTVALIKKVLVEISYELYSKLKFVGVGYRVFQMEKPLENQIFLKLGYSHIIYFKIPNEFNSFSSKFTKLFIYGKSSHSKITQITSLIRDSKLPEPYKGKGILRYEEKISLKKGKKI